MRYVIAILFLFATVALADVVNPVVAFNAAKAAATAKESAAVSAAHSTARKEVADARSKYEADRPVYKKALADEKAAYDAALANCKTTKDTKAAVAVCQKDAKQKYTVKK